MPDDFVDRVFSVNAEMPQKTVSFCIARVAESSRAALHSEVALYALLLNVLFPQPALSASAHDDDVAPLINPVLVQICAASMKHLP